jgi:glutathione S-transferase
MTDLKLYYSPGACSLAPHVALEEVGVDYEPVKVALAKGEQRTPEYLALNPKGRVPVLAEDGWVLTENAAILPYIAQRFPDAALWPADPREAARCAEWIGWIASTVHVSYAHVRRPERYATDPKAIEDVVAKGKESCRDVWGHPGRSASATPSPTPTSSCSGPGAAGPRSASTWRTSRTGRRTPAAWRAPGGEAGVRA